MRTTHLPGRPAKGGQKRHNKVTVAFTDAELKHIERLAKETGLRKAAFIRRASLNSRIYQRLTPEQNKCLQGMHKFGNNLNLLLRTLHRQNCYRFDEAIEGFINDFYAFKREITQSVYGR